MTIYRAELQYCGPSDTLGADFARAVSSIHSLECFASPNDDTLAAVAFFRRNLYRMVSARWGESAECLARFPFKLYYSRVDSAGGFWGLPAALQGEFDLVAQPPEEQPA